MYNFKFTLLPLILGLLQFVGISPYSESCVEYSVTGSIVKIPSSHKTAEQKYIISSIKLKGLACKFCIDILI